MQHITVSWANSSASALSAWSASLLMRAFLSWAFGSAPDPGSGRVFSYFAAATATFSLNRAWTFRTADRSRPLARDWSVFLLVNLVGFVCNYGTYAALIAGVPLVRELPVLGVAAGSLAGMAGNFVLSRRYVFRNRYEPTAP